MALRRLLSKRLFDRYTVQPPAINLDHSAALVQQNATKPKFHREYLTSPDSAEKGFFRRFFHRRAMNQLPEFLNVPAGDKLREKLINNITSGSDRLHLEGLSPPSVEGHRRPTDSYGISVEDVRKVLRISQVEKLKARLREIPVSSISYSEFVQICARECGNQDQGVEFGKMLDQSGYVIVLGDIVFLHPDQVAKTMEEMISQSIAAPNDPRRRQLEQMERQKAVIDQKARALVRGELYCGLGFLVVQTMGFMRLTFWELSWDVMEPICYFVTSLHFALAYGFFLRTSTEPSFEGYFQRRFKAKQAKLMKIHNFDLETYNKLRKAFYPNLSSDDHHYSEKYNRPPYNHEKEAFSENMQY